jgi:hypothetical protein
VGPVAVAAAFGLRVTGADRDLVLDVWQRPSHGRAGDVEAAIKTQRPHRFGYAEPRPLSEILPESAPREFAREAKLRTTRRDADARDPARRHVSVLLLRLGREKWGPLPEVDAEMPDSETRPLLHLHVDDAAGVLPSRAPSIITIHELRCVPPAGGRFPWDAIPPLVAASADWIERKCKSADLKGHTLLLGAVMPPETAVGLGITAGHTHRTQWPENIWPLVYQAGADSLVVPDLNLGTAGRM